MNERRSALQAFLEAHYPEDPYGLCNDLLVDLRRVCAERADHDARWKREMIQAHSALVHLDRTAPSPS